MSVKSLYRILALLFAAAYIGATMLQAAPTYVAKRRYEWFLDERHDARAGRPGREDALQRHAPNCVTDIGCIL